jgi:tol-pal system protein YbgF
LEGLRRLALDGEMVVIASTCARIGASKGGRARALCAAFLVSPALALLAFAAGLAPLPVAAQSTNETRALLDRVERLERDLNTVQRQIYRSGAPDGVTPDVPSTGGSGPAAAAQEVRLSAIEDQMRQLNGRIEELGFQAKQLSDRLDKMQQDVDFRLSALEHGQGGAGQVGGLAAVPGPASASPNAADGGVAASPPNGPATGGPALGAPPRPLGTVDPNAVAAVPPPVASAGDDIPTTVIGGTPKEQYEQSRAKILQKDYAGAASGLEAFLKAYPDDPLAGAAQYWLGESHYAQGHFDDAAAAFLTGLKKYPKSSKAPDSMLKLGMTLNEMGQKKESCATLAEIPNRYPQASLAIKQRAQKERERAGCS